MTYRGLKKKRSTLAGANQPGTTGGRSRSNSLVVELVPISDLKLTRRPLRKGRDERIAKHSRALEAFGQVIPVVADLSGTVVIGSERVEAAKLNDHTHIQVIRLTHLDEEKIKAFRLMEAKIADMGELDYGNIKLEFEGILEIAPGFNFDLTGFEIAEQDLILDFGTSTDAGASDPADTLPIVAAGPAVTKLGDVWIMKGHRIICGDARKTITMEQLLKGECAACVVCDPPFNVRMTGHAVGLGETQHREFVMASGELTRREFAKFLRKSLKRLRDACRDGACIYLFMDWRSVELLLEAGRKLGLTLLNICVWNKTNGGMGSFYRSKHELVCAFKKGNAPHRNNIQLGKFGRYRTNVWDYAGINTFGTERKAQLEAHPTSKPVALIADAIKDCTQRGDIVLDGFAGSGTILIAAEKVGRLAYCIELDPLYVDVAIRRFQDRFGVDAVHEASGLTFSKLAEQRDADPAIDDAPLQPAPPVRGRIRTRRRPTTPLTEEV